MYVLNLRKEILINSYLSIYKFFFYYYSDDGDFPYNSLLIFILFWYKPSASRLLAEGLNLWSGIR